jgi:hypothetical protein
MCVFKNHAFIYFLRPPSWSGTIKPRCIEQLRSDHERTERYRGFIICLKASHATGYYTLDFVGPFPFHSPVHFSPQYCSPYIMTKHSPYRSKSRGRHYKRYSVIAITLHNVFSLLHNALYLWRIVVASDSYRFRLFAGVIAHDSYRSELAGQCYRFTSLSFWVTYASVIASREVIALIWG